MNSNIKKVFYIIGTGRSGSTLLDLMLGNDEKGFSIGELRCLMRPYRRRHLLKGKKCKCNEENCSFWGSIKAGGEKYVYSNLFEKTDANFLVDSSKNTLWLRDQIRYSQGKDYKIIPLLIYKEPLEYLYSKHKRGNESGWKGGWVRTHKRIFGTLDDMKTVKYRELAIDPRKKLKALCEKLGIKYFEGKEKFWNNQHDHFLFGSGTVRNSEHMVYYEDQFDEGTLEYLKNNFNYEDETTKQILKVLEAYEISGPNSIDNGIKQLKKRLSSYSTVYKVYHRLRETPFYYINKTMNKILGTS